MCGAKCDSGPGADVTCRGLLKTRCKIDLSALPSHTGDVSYAADYWEEIYSTKLMSDVSWYQREPEVSLRLVTSVSSAASAVIDVGAGASFLADRLLALDYTDVTLLDVSQRALDEVVARIGDDVNRLHCVQCDILAWSPDRLYDVWHDRAVFHFLSEPEQRARYVEIATKTLCSGGALVLGVFAEDGPAQCSGLSVVRYTPDELGETFGPSFVLESNEREEHVTPSGVVQHFTWVVLRKQ